MIQRLAVMMFLLLAGLGAGPVAAEYTPPQAPPAPEAGSLLLRLFGMTLFVLLLCAVIIGGLRRLRGPMLPGSSDPTKLQLLETVSIGRRCTAHLLQAGNCRVLVAVDPGGVRSCQIVDDEFATLLPASARPAEGPSVEELMSLLAASRAA